MTTNHTNNKIKTFSQCSWIEISSPYRAYMGTIVTALLTCFGIFCRFRSLYTYNGYNKFDWLTLILRSNWTCRIWFGILSSRAFCIVVSDFVYLLPFLIISLQNIQRTCIEPIRGWSLVHNNAIINHHVHLISLT